MYQKLYLPFLIKAPLPKSDSLDDVHIRFSRLISYIGEVLLASQIAKENPNLPENDELKVNLTTREGEKINIPSITFQLSDWNDLLTQIPNHLFFSSIVQLATIYEVFLSELIREILLKNDEWLEKDERQLKAKEIFQMGSISEIRSKFINGKILDYAMSNYPNKVKKFEKDFHVGLHQKDFPLSLFEVHDFLEVRNVIVHNDGYASEQYFERMNDYNLKNLLTAKHTSLEADFSWLFEFGQELLSLCVLIDEKIGEKWKTTRNT